MARTKKLTDLEFTELVINKELEIANAPIRFKDISFENKDKHPNWYSEYSFDTKEQFLEWKNYFCEQFYNWQPKRVSKTSRNKEFAWFNLMYGLRCNFEWNEISK